MSTTLGDNRLNENSKWTPEEDAILTEAVIACESFSRAFRQRLTQVQPSWSEALLEYYLSRPSRKDQQVLQKALDPFFGSVPS